MGDYTGVDITGRRISEGTLELIADIDRCNSELPDRVTGEPTYEAIKRLREDRDLLLRRENKSAELYCEKCGDLLGIKSCGHLEGKLHEAMLLVIHRGDEITRLKKELAEKSMTPQAPVVPEREASDQ